MKPSSAIAKGKILEEYVCIQLKEKNIDPKAQRSYGSGNGNGEKADINTTMMILGQNAGIECKNQATLHIRDWWRQTQKLQSLGREPVLVFKQFGEPLAETKCIIFLDTLLELVKTGQNAPMTAILPADEGDNREKRWALENLKVAVNKALKQFS